MTLDEISIMTLDEVCSGSLPPAADVLYGVSVGAATGTYCPPALIASQPTATGDATQVLTTAEFGPVGSFTTGAATSGSGGGSGTAVSEVTLPNIAAGMTWTIALNPTSALVAYPNGLTAISLKKNGTLLTLTTDYTVSHDDSTYITFAPIVPTVDGDALKAQALATFASGATLTKV